MSDRIELTIRYSFKGETFEPSASFDLDAAMRNNGQLPDFIASLARQNDIDAYSYEYEVLPHGEFIWRNPAGLASECMTDGEFDPSCYQQRWYKKEQMQALQNIALKHLGIDDIDSEPDLKQALVAAFRAGKRAKPFED